MQNQSSGCTIPLMDYESSVSTVAKLVHPDLGAHLLGANPVQVVAKADIPPSFYSGTGHVPLRLMVYEDDDLADDIYRSASAIGATGRVNSRRSFLWSFLLIRQKKANKQNSKYKYWDYYQLQHSDIHKIEHQYS